jgi:hypothetical protein
MQLQIFGKDSHGSIPGYGDSTRAGPERWEDLVIKLTLRIRPVEKDAASEVANNLTEGFALKGRNGRLGFESAAKFCKGAASGRAVTADKSSALAGRRFPRNWTFLPQPNPLIP